MSRGRCNIFTTTTESKKKKICIWDKIGSTRALQMEHLNCELMQSMESHNVQREQQPDVEQLLRNMSEAIEQPEAPEAARSARLDEAPASEVGDDITSVCSSFGGTLVPSVSIPALDSKQDGSSEPEPVVHVYSGMANSIGSRGEDEDANFDGQVVPGGRLTGVFDGHGGAQISALTRDKSIGILRVELGRRVREIEDAPDDEAHLAVSEAFSTCTDALHKTIKALALTGGSTACFVYQTHRFISCTRWGTVGPR